jgi:3-oxoadipate enol-lactonase
MRRVLLGACAVLLGGAISQVHAQPQEPTRAGTPAGLFAKIGEAQLYYEECGSGSNEVVLIHDGVVNSAAWNDVWPEFCRHFHTFRYDRRGYGRSPAATTWYSEIDDLASLLQQLKVSRVALVGSSHGGELSIDFTLAHPDLVRRLVLVGPVVSGLPYSRHFLDRGADAFALLDKGDVKGAIARWSNDKYLIAPGNETARRRLYELLTSNPQDMTHRDYPLRPKPALPRLHEIRVQTLILVGDADIPDVHAHAGAIEAGIANSRRVVVEGVGHIMYLEKPAQFSALVIGFLERN